MSFGRSENFPISGRRIAPITNGGDGERAIRSEISGCNTGLNVAEVFVRVLQLVRKARAALARATAELGEVGWLRRAAIRNDEAASIHNASGL